MKLSAGFVLASVLAACYCKISKMLEPAQCTFDRSAEQNIQQLQAQQQEMFKFIAQRQLPNSFAALADRTPWLNDGPANDTEQSILRRLRTIESLPDDSPVSLKNQGEVSPQHQQKSDAHASDDRFAPKDSAIVPLAKVCEQPVPSPCVFSALDFLEIMDEHKREVAEAKKKEAAAKREQEKKQKQAGEPQVQAAAAAPTKRVRLSKKTPGHGPILFAKPFVLLFDGDGHRMALDWRGANVNVLKKGSNLAHRRPYFVEIDCVDPQKFILATCDDVKTAMDVLSVAFARVEDGPLGLIADVELRSVLDVAKAIHYDWARTLLSDGVFTQEVNMLIGSAAAMGKFSIKVVIAFMKDSSWRFPAITAIKDKAFLKIFESHSTGDEAFRLKASSSESVATALRRNPLCCRRFWT